MLITRNLLALGAALAPLAVWGCSSNSSPPANDGGSSSTVATSSGATSSGTSSTSATSSSSGTTAACNDAGTLYTRLGSHAGIRGAIDKVVTAELGDPDEVTYFFWQLHPTAGHPSADQVSECFTDLLASVAGGPEQYPPDGGVFDDAGVVKTWQCRADMKALHVPLMISGGTFDQFITVAAPVLLDAGVQPCDLATIATVLESTKTAIVDPALADAGSQMFPGDAAALLNPPADAGGQ
jgi:hypothetical protein